MDWRANDEEKFTSLELFEATIYLREKRDRPEDGTHCRVSQISFRQKRPEKGIKSDQVYEAKAGGTTF